MNMTAHHSRKLLLAAMLAMALSAPALANDTATTAQQTSVGQGTEVASQQQDDAVVAKESYATVTNGPVTASTAPRARAKATEPRRVVSVARPAGDYYRGSGAPLILGIRH
jgi:type II secretory pathway pseudopilin PulG